MSGNVMETIVIIDDETNIVELARLYLEREGFKVAACGKGREGISLVSASNPNLVILDIMLPDIDGFEVLKRLRSSSKVPVLMLSARREDVDKIVGLEMGADDYLTKPFNPHELLARVKAVLRRSQPPASAGQVIELGKLRIDSERHEAAVNGSPIELRARELSLLIALARQPGIVFSRERLLNQVWGYDYYGDTRTVDVHINHLRDKLKGSGIDIETLRGTGYRLVAGGAA
ncbi:response regulator transcription factor [Dehalogenimonas sp. 4OHTPN]|uniref:Response regulator transcription factor n=1 Tax=Dehalogenimonas sp. 4OHTPN TaxID=3166643 RepID=A0AAU8G9E8_9CHLR